MWYPNCVRKSLLKKEVYCDISFVIVCSIVEIRAKIVIIKLRKRSIIL